VHQRGILHGDIKPANLIITPQGTPKIMDFGVARRSQTTKGGFWSLGRESEIWGTPGYLAPERLGSDQIDARADVFSLGVVAYEWLAGRKPFRGDTVEEILKVTVQGRAPSLSELGSFDAELSSALDRALARNPAQRFDSADAMADALEICQERWFKQSSEHHPRDSTTPAQVISFPRLKKGRNVLFADFTDEDLANIMQVSRQETYQEGDTILREGTGGSTMYVVIRGRVSVRKISGTKEVEIKRVSKGECFGEMAVISQMPRSASVVALQPTEVVAISGAVLRSANQVLCMKLYRNIASLLAERMREKDDQMVELLDSEPEKKTGQTSLPILVIREEWDRPIIGKRQPQPPLSIPPGEANQIASLASFCPRVEPQSDRTVWRARRTRYRLQHRHWEARQAWLLRSCPGVRALMRSV
jgi:serine/threonine-protein kinase